MEYMEGKTDVPIKLVILGLAVKQHKLLFKLMTVLKLCLHSFTVYSI
jgi:hypothetical protein